MIITKEMAVGASLIEQLPPSVRLICEAGTGYNNVDIDAARARGIAVSNVPMYSTDAMATMAITFVLSMSCSLVPQQRALWSGSNEHFARECIGGLPHFELGGKTIGLIGGLGTIGRRVTEMARALGANMLISAAESAMNQVARSPARPNHWSMPGSARQLSGTRLACFHGDSSRCPRSQVALLFTCTLCFVCTMLFACATCQPQE